MAFLFHFWRMNICFNGAFFPADERILTAQNRCFKWGDGVFETMKFYQGQLLLAGAHFERLFSSLRLLQMDTAPTFSKENLLCYITDLCVQNRCSQNARVRLAVYRNKSNTAEFVIEAIPLEIDYSEWQHDGLSLCLYPYARKSTDVFANLKSANFLPYVLAQKFAADHQFDDAILLNSANLLCDTSKTNLFLIRNGQVYTPALHQGCVNGVMRKAIVDALERKGNSVNQAELSEEDLLAADEVFLSNAIQVIRWVKSYRQRTFANTHTRKIFDEVSATIFSSSC